METTRYNLEDNPTIFGKILRKEIPANIVYEDDKALAFWDIAPKAPVHIIIIPKQHLACLRCMETSDANLMAHLLHVANIVAEKLDVKESGYRLITNAGQGAGQEVPHLHFHLLASKKGEHLPGF
ncbi:MAG: histidine triad nucleotide-binding protein [Alphaproteobacteria bacterium CG_4_10_14_0_8_um_filter_53_9]|nr:MAG: histidine triad nucleotide-binding protein [Alphaproteobacteria bacterium CG_4_10_14_0_8_um_filter_53_9]